MNVSKLHHIQKHILKELSFKEWARFRDLKPPRVDSNLYNYHLKLLIKNGLVEKDNDKGYRLSPLGLRYVGHVSLNTYELRWQPKVLTKLVCISKNNQILMWPKHKQPYIGRWSLPNGKIHFEDASVEDAIKREITYLTKDIPRDLKNIGVIEYRTYISDHLVSHSIAHIFTAQIDSIYHQYAKWIDIKNVDSLKLTPSTAETIFFAQNEKQYFYKKLDIEW